MCGACEADPAAEGEEHSASDVLRRQRVRNLRERLRRGEIHTQPRSPNFLRKTGTKGAMGRYVTALMLPSQFTWLREIPNSADTIGESVRATRGGEWEHEVRGGTRV